MRKILHLAAVAALLSCAACATDTVTMRSLAAAQQPTPAEEKMSLDQAVDEYGKVSLLDDETGETKMVCKRVKQTGTRFGRKVCATPKEWAQKKQDGREGLTGLTRRMDATCPAGRVCG